METNIYDSYTLSPYLHSDNSETITISQSDSNNDLILECIIESNSLRSNKKNSSGLSTGAIIGIICGTAGILIITVVIFILLRKTHNKNINENSSINALQNTDFSFKIKWKNINWIYYLFE